MLFPFPIELSTWGRRCCVCACLFLAGSLQAAAEEVEYARHIRPLLARKCYACHGPETQEAGFAIHEAAAAVRVLDSGTVGLKPGNLSESEIWQRVTATDPDLRMPPGDHAPLSATELSQLKQWIEQGAEFTEHWAFAAWQPVPVPDGDPAVGPIDRFINVELQQQGLQATAEADRRTLIRRLSYDLTGLPPTVDEVQEFERDTSVDAYEKLVDRLLASPHYGERWARHWLDVVRYAETNSFERDGPKPNAWKYRDYVIRSFNDDKPYDQFLREQLAGDEFEQPTPDSIVATAFYRLGVWDDEPADPLLARYDEYDSIVTTISQGLLGLTVNCSRCHDHKIDPIPQADYYKLVAFLQELTPYGTRGDEKSFSQTDVSPDSLKERYTNLETQLRDLRKTLHEQEQVGVVKMSAEDQRRSETREREKLLKEKLQDYLDADAWTAYSGLKAEETRLAEELKQLPPRQMVLSVAKVNPRPEPTHVMLRGNPHVPGDVVGPGFPQIFQTADPQIPAAADGARSSGRRTVLANWIASDANRLTARVLVNRLWQHHFGRGIVRTPNNFGFLGAPPTHPELLDWLAGELVSNGWRMKPLHKQIVMSQAYRRSSRAVPASLARDPNNDLFWRFDLRRLSAEELRDTVLATSGQLNLKLHGPSIFPELSKEVLSTQSRPGEGWGKSAADQQARRSIYIYIKRSLIPPELASFDFPETDVTCEARFITIQPAQALNMINGDFLNRQAQHLAARLIKTAESDSTRVDAGWQLALARSPRAAERETSDALLATLRAQPGLTENDVWKYYCLYLLNLNEVMFVD